MATVERARSVPWWKEPTKDQWYAWWAAWLGWTLDAFDFTVFLLIMEPIAEEFDVPLTEVASVFTMTLWMRLVGAVGLGLARRPDRPQDAADDLDPLVFDLQLHRRLLADLLFLLVFRTLLGIGMGAEWPAGAALAMETWPMRSRGFMSGVLQGSWGIGFLLSSVHLRAVLRLYRLARHAVDRRAAGAVDRLRPLLRQGAGGLGREPAASSASRTARSARRWSAIFKRGMLGNTLPGVLVDGEQFRPLLLDLGAVRDASAEGPEAERDGYGGAVHVANIVGFLGDVVLGLDGRHHRPPLGDDHPGGDRGPDRADLPVHRRLVLDHRSASALQGAFGGALYSQLPSYLSERFPTEVRATASAFCYHQGAIFGGLVAPVLAYFAVEFQCRLRDPDAGRHRRRRVQRRRLAAAEPGNQGQGPRSRAVGGLNGSLFAHRRVPIAMGRFALEVGRWVAGE